MSDNPARVLFHLNGPGIRTTAEQFSIHVSRTLDCLGKTQDMVKYRVKMYRDMQRISNILTSSSFQLIHAGSKGEGLTALYESDLDYMYVLHEVICADNVRPYIHNRNKIVFKNERLDTPAGYTKLKLIQEGRPMMNDPDIHDLVHDSLFQYANGERYISSDCFITKFGHIFKDIENVPDQIHARSGPSLPTSCTTSKMHKLHVDVVLAFCCVCPNVLQAFITRPRPYNRPSRRILKDISKMDTHVVPVGCKESDTAYLEWRICFTQAEIHLIHNFNDIETKLYILLKMIAKLLKNISKDITSYLMKNVVLWLVELYPDDMFTEELLTERLIQALKFLKNCVGVNYLPNYMIPDRNLLAGRLEPVQRRKLTSFLSTLIREEGYLLLRCEKLQVAMAILYREPDMTEEFRWRRDMFEKIYLLQMKMAHDNQAESLGVEHTTLGVSVQQMLLLFVSDERSMNCVLAFFNLALPEFPGLLRQGYSLEAFIGFVFERIAQLLS